MNRLRPSYLCLYRWRSQSRNKTTNMNQGEENLLHLCKHLEIRENVATRLSMKHPVVNKIDEPKIISLIRTIHALGYPKEVLFEEPRLLALLPVTIKFRHQVLKECGFINITPKLITSYLRYMKQKRIGDLKKLGMIPNILNVENHLASYMTQWPTSLTASVSMDTNNLTLYLLRIQIIQRYLELTLDLQEHEFKRGILTYPNLKHRPLAAINETLTLLQAQVMMPTHKIKSNLYLVHSDPENLKNILNKLRFIGGIDIKEVIRMHPRIAMRNYNTLLEVKNIMKEYEISDEAQKRCFDIYTLSSSTVRERLEKTKSIPEFKTFDHHPRFLKMIHYNNTAMKRLHKLYSNNKKCLSLNILSGSAAHYEVFEKAPGDRLGKGKDLIFCISESLGRIYNSRDIHKIIKRHPFWINIPLVQVKYVYEQLSNDFTPSDIYENCFILLYPWNKINAILRKFKINDITYSYENLDTETISKSQKLSLVLYALEKDHYFSGNGVWTEEKNKNIVT